MIVDLIQCLYKVVSFKDEGKLNFLILPNTKKISLIAYLSTRRNDEKPIWFISEKLVKAVLHQKRVLKVRPNAKGN